MNPSKKLLILSLFITNVIVAQKTVTTYHYGTKKVKESYQVNAQGLRNGFYKSYAPSGELLFNYNFKNGQEHGLCIDYAGTRDWREIYCYGKPLDERVMENGKIKTQKYYDCANNTNRLAYEKKRVNADVYEKSVYHTNGKIKEKFFEDASYTRANGPYLRYHENGKLAEKGNIENGKAGDWYEFYENGDTLSYSKFEFGIAVVNKKFSKEKNLEYLESVDHDFDTIIKKQFYPDGKIKLYRVSKTYPFTYGCGSSNDPNNPKSWRDLAKSGIICGGESYSPFDHSYVLTETKYTNTGEIESTLDNELRVIKNKNIVALKSNWALEDSLYKIVTTENTYQSFRLYRENTPLKVYSDDVYDLEKALDKYNEDYADSVRKEAGDLNNTLSIAKKELSNVLTNAQAHSGHKLYESFKKIDDFYSEKINQVSKVGDSTRNVLKNQYENTGRSSARMEYYKYELNLRKSILSLTNRRKGAWDKLMPAMQDKELQSKILAAKDRAEIFQLLNLPQED